MLMLGLNKAMDQLAMVHGVHWYGQMLKREDVHVLRMASGLEVVSQRRIERLNMMMRKPVDGESCCYVVNRLTG